MYRVVVHNTLTGSSEEFAGEQAVVVVNRAVSSSECDCDIYSAGTTGAGETCSLLENAMSEVQEEGETTRDSVSAMNVH